MARWKRAIEKEEAVGGDNWWVTNSGEANKKRRSRTKIGRNTGQKP